MVSIDEMIKALDKVTPGIASDETLLYGVEVKFYSNKVIVDKKFETNVSGLRCHGRRGGSDAGTPAGISQWDLRSKSNYRKNGRLVMYTKTDFGENGRYYARPAAVNSND